LHRETYRETDLDSWIYLLVELLSITTMSDYVTSTFVWWIEPKVIADVPEKDVLFLNVGQQVEIISASINTQSSAPVSGVIEQIAFSANNNTRTYRTKVVIDNSSGKLRSGMIVRAKFVRQQLKQVISIPLYAVMDRDGEKIVFLAENGLARKVNVILGSSIGQRVVVEHGLSVNQSLIVSGQQLLIDGAKIEVGEN
ncbi:MAG: efflux RND transporter periplasmic adaptor subunit, partial [Desulfuromusa sp.]|nr:efflux RND transporter periplasmic adaptor subunit [Desulfuromusa sp.]